jgi:hypothetical protein
MRVAAERLLDVLDPDQRRLATAPFDTPDHQEWTYLPGPRPGLAVAELTDSQRGAAVALLATGLSADGVAAAQGIMELDDILRELEQEQGRSGWQRRGSGQYWIRILGRPGPSDPWAWRVNGHHLAVHLTVVGESVAGTPQFFGANPAVVPSGPRAGWQVLKPEEGLARQLLVTLGDEQRASALVDPVAPQDILTRDDPIAEASRVPAGLAFGRLAGAERALAEKLLRVYLDRLAPELARASWQEIEEAGLDAVTFAWAGEVEPRRGHYYALRGPTFLVEYDNVQNNANHVHTVWRDLRNDWGVDVLAEHYRAARH